MAKRRIGSFKGRHFASEVILMGATLEYGVPTSYRNFAAMLADRGAQANHTTLCRWVRQYGGGAAKAEAPRPAAIDFLKPVPVSTADQAAEIARLRRECSQLRMEWGILNSPSRSSRVL